MALTKPQSDESRFVTALFRSPDAAERAYRAATALDYKDADINLVISDATRDALLSDTRHPGLSTNAVEQAEPPHGSHRREGLECGRQPRSGPGREARGVEGTHEA